MNYLNPSAGSGGGQRLMGDDDCVLEIEEASWWANQTVWNTGGHTWTLWEERVHTDVYDVL